MPHPGILLIVITTTLGAILGALGGEPERDEQSESRRSASESANPGNICLDLRTCRTWDLNHQVRVFPLEHRPVLLEHRLRDRDQLQRRLHVAGALDPAAGEGDGTFSLPWKYLFATAESIIISTSGSSDVVRPFPAQVLVAAGVVVGDVDDGVLIGKLEPLGHPCVAQIRAPSPGRCS